MRAMMWVTVAATLLVSLEVHAAQDCIQGKRDLEVARERIAATADDEATVLLNQSIDECPTYDAYETLAEHLSVSDSGRDHSFAADAFVAATALAASKQDRAQTLFQYAAMLNREDDPQNAYPLIQQALALDAQRSPIKRLAAEIDTKIQNPKTAELTRALSYSSFKPLKGKGDARHGLKASPTGGAGQINLPIYFNSNSTEVDEATRVNVEKLAEVLADDGLKGRKIVFIGHSDQRGDDIYNESLSRARAQAISESVIAIRPELKGRLLIEGHGAREPVKLGTDDDSLRANRRLQVITE